jgi:hypothetical protein
VPLNGTAFREAYRAIVEPTLLPESGLSQMTAAGPISDIAYQIESELMEVIPR